MLNVHRAWQMLRFEKADPNADGIYRTLAWTHPTYQDLQCTQSMTDVGRQTRTLTGFTGCDSGCIQPTKTFCTDVLGVLKAWETV